MPQDGKHRASTLDCFDHLRVGLALFDPDDVLTYCNEHFRFIYRSLHDVERIIGLKFEDILHILVDNGEIAGSLVVEDREKWIRDRLETHRARAGRTTERLTDGRWIDIKERLLPDGGVIGYWADATDRIRYRLRLESAMDCMADGFAAWDQAGRLDMFNAKFAERYAGKHGPPERGQSFGEVITRLAFSGKLKLDCSPEDWVRRQMEARRLPSVRGYLDYDDESYFILNEKRTLEGSVVTTLTDVTVLKEQERELIFRGQSLQQANAELEMAKAILEKQGQDLVAMAEDIEMARRRLAEQNAELERMEARERAILETMAEALLVVGADGNIESLNRSAETVFGYTSEEAAGRDLSLLFEGPLAGAFGPDGDPEKHGRRWDVLARCKEGKTFAAEVAVSEVGSVGGNFHVLTVRDISDRKRTEAVLRRSHDILEERVLERTRLLSAEVEGHKHTMEHLRRAKEEAELASRAKSDFLANMSHELRTPLNAVIGFSEAIRNNVFGPLENEKYAEYIVNIQESGQHLLELINEILDVSAIESGHLDLNPEEVDLSHVVAETLRLIRPRAEKGQIRVVADLPDDLGPFRTDRRRFKQVLLNLLSNAVKFTEAGGRVALSVERGKDGGAVTVVVEDTGVGMTPDELEMAVKPFAQVDSVQTRRFEGSGLGLPLTKGLVESQGGTLHMESEKGKGTKVTVHLPRIAD